MPDTTPLANPAAVVHGPHVRFMVLTERLIRMEHSPNDRFEDRPSQAFWYRRQPVPQFRSRVDDQVIQIETEYLQLEYRPNPAGFQRTTLSILLKQSGATWRYGMRDAGNLGGTARTLDMAAGQTRLGAGLISRSGWALVDDSHSLVFDDTGWLKPRENKDILDLYFFGYGTAFAGCLQDFTKVAGPIPMIPRYILGNWWSRYWAYRQEELQALMEDFRQHEVPLSVCIIDMDWHITQTGNASTGWTGYTWNRALFPDPPGLIDWLHKQGLKTALNLHPAEGIHPHEEQYAQMARWMGIDPASRKPISFDVTDKHFMEGYFKFLHHPQEALGVDFWWLDWQQGRKSRVPGLDPLWALNHLHFQDLGRDGRKRPFIFSRWGGLGNHRYPIGFSGDTIILWRSLRFQPYFTATAANVAYGWWSHDIGGHMFQDGSPELYVRWVQFGLFSPILRLHSTNKPKLERRPWGKPERYFLAARDAMQLRHAFVPYLYSMAWRAHRTGLSPILPMYYADNSEQAFACPDQYLFGSELVAAPVVRPVRRSTGLASQKVWLPAGKWFHFFTGETFHGGARHTIQSTLEEIPVFARAGAIIPLGPKTGWGGVANPKILDLLLFPGGSNQFELYEDDGETTAYQQGEYALTRFTLEQAGETLTFIIHPTEGECRLVPPNRLYRVHLRGVEANCTCTHPASYDPFTRTLTLEPVRLTPDQEFSTQFHILPQ
jgi:alpha-glucosidase (family GH31 glycosyl hydrolase)